MFTPTPDYSQQLYAYLQTWRQSMEQWAAMPPGPSFPTAPPLAHGAECRPHAIRTARDAVHATAAGRFGATHPCWYHRPPAPADYTQQLFKYLQAWRQYLEQMTGARPASPQPPTAQPANAAQNPPGKNGGSPPPSGGPPPPGGPPSPSDVPTPPGDDTSGAAIPENYVQTGSTATWPPLLNLPPSNYGGNQIVGPGFAPSGPFVHGLENPQVLIPPDHNFGTEFRRPLVGPAISSPVSSARPEATRHRPEAPAEFSAGSPFRSAMERVDPDASPQFVRKSLFSSPGAQAGRPGLRNPVKRPRPKLGSDHLRVGTDRRIAYCHDSPDRLSLSH